MAELTQTNLQELCMYLEELYLEGTLISRIGTNTLISVGSDSTTSQHLQHEATHLTNQIQASNSNSLSLIFTGISASGKSDICKSLLQTFHSPHTYLSTLLDTFTHAITSISYNATQSVKLGAFYFDSSGKIIAYEILRHFLLDTFRVTSRNGFNFHIFYLLAKGAPNETINELFLSGLSGKYLKVQKNLGAEINATKGYEMMMKVFKECGFDCDVIASILELLSAILLVGDLEFVQTGLTTCEVSNQDQLMNISTLLGAQVGKLGDALTHVTLQTKTGRHIKNTLTVEQSRVVCDTLARGLYTKLIDWLITKINNKKNADLKGVKLLKVLEIPGFDNTNEANFESLLVNFSFEKINNMLTSFIIRDKQAEFEKEGIGKVSVDPFDNFNVCHLMLDNFRGILPIIDATCIQKTVDPKVIIKNLNSNCGNSHLFSSGIAISVRASNNCFRIKHHLGQVTYDVTSFKQKNLDRTSFNITEIMYNCQHPALAGKFDRKDKVKSVLRQTSQLLNDIITAIKGSEIFTVHCLKANANHELNLFDRKFVTEQVRYMNLTEIIKLQKYGFKYSEKITDFISKYQSIAGCYRNEKPHQTCKRIMLGFSIPECDYIIGKSKVFFSSADSVAILQKVREISFSKAAIILQKYFKGWRARVQFQNIRKSQIIISSNFRAFCQRKNFLTLRTSANVISKYAKGYQTRNWYYWVLEENARISAVTIISSYFRGWRIRKQFKFSFSGNAKVLIQRFFLNLCRYLYLTRLARNLPSLSPVRFDWPDSPRFMRETSDILFKLFHSWRCELYRGMLLRNPPHLLQMKEKLLANNIFRRKKASYPKSIPLSFQGDRLGLSTNVKWKRIALQTGGFTPIVWDSNVLKVNRTNGKFQERILVVTRQDVLLIDPTNFKLLQQFTLHTLKQISVSTYSDGCFILHLSSLPTVTKSTPLKGDLIFMCPHLIEVVAKTSVAVRELTNRNLPVLIRNEIQISGKDGEKIFVEFVYTKGGQYVSQPKRIGNRLIFTL
ncbi:hypothetical protein LOD99_12947 [Oopsacas minuta]|uniref:Uncharacterized protein n=1 Tax=Oopsacas minuta TaxID=111878 RepID=A0AAV7JAG9_9METZ|nr:hypothetical protein LOD99_12947 [Oopsacas minuta]